MISHFTVVVHCLHTQVVYAYFVSYRRSAVVYVPVKEKIENLSANQASQPDPNNAIANAKPDPLTQLTARSDGLFPPDWGMLRKSRRVQIFISTINSSTTNNVLKLRAVPINTTLGCRLKAEG